MPLQNLAAMDSVEEESSGIYDQLEPISDTENPPIPSSKSISMWLAQPPPVIQLVMDAMRKQGPDRLMAAADKLKEIYEEEAKKPKLHELLLKRRIDKLSERIEEFNKSLKNLPSSKNNGIPSAENQSEIGMKIDSSITNETDRKTTKLFENLDFKM